MAKTKIKTEKTNVKKTVKAVKQVAEAIEAVQTKVPAKIKNYLKRIIEIQAQEELLSVEKAALKEEVKTYMKKGNLKELLTDEIKALYSTSQRTSFDKESFEKDHPKMYKEYLKYQVKSDKIIESLKVDSTKKTTRKK